MLMRSLLFSSVAGVVLGHAGHGTILDINNGTAGSFPDYLVTYNNASSLFFRASLDGSTANLFSTAGGIELETWTLGDAGSYPAYITEFMGNLVLSADDGQGAQLWVFNPTADPHFSKVYTNQGIPVPNPGQPDGFLERDGKLFFAASAVEDVPQPWTVLYNYDGTQAYQISTVTNPRFPINFLGAVYFSANAGPTIGQELHSWDEINGELRVSDFNGASGSFPSFLTVFQDKLFFSMTHDAFGTELFSFDGSAINNEADINEGVGSSNPADLTVYNGKLYFSAMSSAETGVELYSFDGSNYELVENINPTGSSLSYPAYLTVVWDLLLFSADDGTHGAELWAHDGNKTWMLRDLNAGDASSNPSNFIEFADDVYFVATTEAAGRELWLGNGLIPNPNDVEEPEHNNTDNSTDVCYNVNTECQLDDECCTGYCELGGPMPAKPQPHKPPKTERPHTHNETEEDEDENETATPPYPKRRELKEPKTTLAPKTPTNPSYTEAPGSGSNETSNETDTNETNPETPDSNGTNPDSNETNPDSNETTTTLPPKRPPAPLHTHAPKVPVPNSKGKDQKSGNWSYRCMCRPAKMECTSGSQCCSGSCVRWDGHSTKMSRGSKGTKHTPHSKGSMTTPKSAGNYGSSNTTEEDEEVVWVCAEPPRAKSSKNLGKSLGYGLGLGGGMGALITIAALTRRSLLRRRRETAEASTTEGEPSGVAMTEQPAFKFVPTQTPNMDV